MSLLLLVPGLVSLISVLRGRIDFAFLSVYLPCLLCLPDEYKLRIPHLPPTSAAEFALIPIGVVALYRLIRSASFALMDLLVLLYTASVSLSELLHSSVTSDGIFAAFNAFVYVVLSYAVGRRLIGPELRLPTVCRIVILVLLDGPSAIWEWRMGQSPYGVVAHRFLGLTALSEGITMRDGHGRSGIALGGGELAGIASAMTFCLNGWLVHLRRTKASVNLGKILERLEKYHLVGLYLVLYTAFTQSRGPMIALGAGYLIVQITKFKNTRIMTILVAVVLLAGYFTATAYYESYSGDPAHMTEKSTSVLYRKELNKLYPPVAEKGGWTGYGMLDIPVVQGMISIDNQYLLVHLAWGRLAYYLFILIVWENTRVLLVRSWQFEALQDRAFALSMLGAMAVLWFTLLTVFMGGQLTQFAFLLVGWMQSTGAPRKQQYSFLRVFT